MLQTGYDQAILDLEYDFQEGNIKYKYHLFNQLSQLVQMPQFNNHKNHSFISVICLILFIQLFIFILQDQDINNVINAKNAGLKVHVLYQLCRNKPLSELGQQLIKYFGSSTIENVWLFGRYDASGECSWFKHSGQQNCQYLKQMMEGLKKYNITAGTIIFRQYWTYFFGPVSACPELSNLLTWWTPQEDDQDLQPNFNSYKQIGGQTRPFMKLYNARQICGAQDVLINYYE